MENWSRPAQPGLGLDNRDVFRAKNRPGTQVRARQLATKLSPALCNRPHGSERRSPLIFRPRKRSGVGVSLDTSFDALSARRHGHLRSST